MKTKKVIQNLLRNVGILLGKFATAILSGIPRNKINVKPYKKTNIHIGNEHIKISDERHYHKPVAKPVVEKQTLLKEKKKVKGSH